MAFIHIRQIPTHFYDVSNSLRWKDDLASQDGAERFVLSPAEIMTKGRRSKAYLAWLAAFGVPGRHVKFQAIQILSSKHSDESRCDWWPPYQDCVFRVFIEPYVVYDGKLHKSWYVLCPEDTEMLHRFEWGVKGKVFPEREMLLERYVSSNPLLRKLRLVPVECCRHWRHETTAGQLPLGL